jgi:DNA recombination protein RmuC
MDTAVVILVSLLVATLVWAVWREISVRQRSRGALAPQTELLDERLRQVNDGVERVSQLVQRSGTELSTLLRTVGDQTGMLTRVLGDSRLRGQWGERTAEDILRVAGFIEGVNFNRQRTLEASGTRPDFEFPLPRGLHLNMDVKFPLDNYARAVEATTDEQRDNLERAFLKDVRNRIKEISTRDYVDPEGGTVDYVLLFIPSESIYAFVSQLDHDLLEGALRQRVVCCSPLTLFAVLAVVRQAVDSFSLQRASDEVVSLMGRFASEWEKYCESLDTLGRRLDLTRNAYEQVVGPRKRQLEKPLERIESIRRERGLGGPEAPPSELTQPELPETG